MSTPSLEQVAAMCEDLRANPWPGYSDVIEALEALESLAAENARLQNEALMCRIFIQYYDKWKAALNDSHEIDAALDRIAIVSGPAADLLAARAALQEFDNECAALTGGSDDE